MSRSYRTNPITGVTTARSEKRDKQTWHRRFRRATAEAIRRGSDLMPDILDVSNVWAFAKDGKVHWSRRAWRIKPWKLWNK